MTPRWPAGGADAVLIGLFAGRVVLGVDCRPSPGCPWSRQGGRGRRGGGVSAAWALDRDRPRWWSCWLGVLALVRDGPAAPPRGGRVGHLGLRLLAADAPDAVHGVVVRASRSRHSSLPWLWTRTPVERPYGLFPARPWLRHRDARPLERGSTGRPSAMVGGGSIAAPLAAARARPDLCSVRRGDDRRPAGLVSGHWARVVGDAGCVTGGVILSYSGSHEGLRIRAIMTARPAAAH